jgi:lipoate-protein ligase A
MAADEALLEAAGAGVASLHFYGWSGPTVSLGYFQPHTARLPGLPYVRRPSGGLMLVHHHELTYCLALPRGAAWQSCEPWLRRMHRIIAAALATLGLSVRIHEPPDVHRDTPLCFNHFTAGDLLAEGFKIVGSAQRRQRGALLQHGGILLGQSSLTPDLAGIAELIGRSVGVEEMMAVVRDAFVAQTGWSLTACGWDDQRGRIETLVAEKYGRPAWNDRR